MKKAIRKSAIFLYRWGLRLFGGMGLQKVWPFGAIRDRLSEVVRNFDRGSSVRYRGHTIFLDPEDNLELSVWGENHGSRKELEFLDRIVKKGDTVVDVGANIGLFTVNLARAVGPHGHIFAFEPAPGNLVLLEKNIRANGYGNVTITPKAATQASGKIQLYLSDFNPGDHRIYNPEEKIKTWDKSSAVYDKLKSGKRQAVSVDSISLDDFFKDFGKPISLVKIDVQGAEGGVLRGMLGLLKKNKDIVIFTEFWPAGLKMFGITADEFLKTLQGLGFSFFELSEGNPLPISIEALLKKYTPENNVTCDLVIHR